MILHENLATEPCVTTSDVGWIVNGEIPARKPNTHIKINIPWSFQTAAISVCSRSPSSLLAICPFHSHSGILGGGLQGGDERTGTASQPCVDGVSLKLGCFQPPAGN